MEEFFTEQFHKLLRRHDDIEKLQSFSVLAGQAFAVAKFLIAIQPTLAELKTGEKHRHHTKRLQTYLNFLFSRPDAKVNSELLKLNFYVNLVIGLSLNSCCFSRSCFYFPFLIKVCGPMDLTPAVPNVGFRTR
jgi:hypothetical protein